MMKIFVIAIVATLLLGSEARFGVLLMNGVNYTEANLKCLRNSGYSRMSVLINFDDRSIDEELSNLNKLYLAGSTTTDIIL